MSVLTLDDAKAHLNINSSDAAQDAEVQQTVNAAEAVITRRIGVLAPAQYSDRVPGEGREALVLPRRPVVSLTSVTPVGDLALLTSDLWLNTNAGVVELVDGGYFNARRYDVIYQAGWTTVPDDLMQAIRELTRHLWESQRARLRSRGGDAGDGTGSGFLMPYRVEALLEPFDTLGVA